MKPLKDIGRELYSIEIDGMITCYTNDSPCDSPALSIVMSPEERRELVRAVWKAACEAVYINEYGTFTEPTIEKFIKEQGL